MKNTSNPELLRFLHLDNYMDSTGRFIRLRSGGKNSNEGKVNRIMMNIEAKDGQAAYIQNRIRENISSRILSEILMDTQVVLSTVTNDLLFHTDAIAIQGEDIYAINFTGDFSALERKGSHIDADGKGYLLGPRGEAAKLPFVVIYIAQELVESILSHIDGALQGGMAHDEIDESIGVHIRKIYEKDKLPSLFIKPKIFGGGTHGRFVQQIENNSLRMGGLHALGLTPSLLQKLLTQKIHTLGELSHMTEEDLRQNFDLKNEEIRQIQTALSKYGRSLCTTIN